MTQEWKERFEEWRTKNAGMYKADDIANFFYGLLKEERNAVLSEERQFVLNVLDGIDIADAQMGIVGGTQAIRQALESRIIKHE